LVAEGRVGEVKRWGGERGGGEWGGIETVLNKIFKNGFISLKCTDCRDSFENCTDCTDLKNYV